MMVSGNRPGGRSTMKSSTTTPLLPFSTISTALMSPPTLPMALATAPSEPGRSGSATRIRYTAPSSPILRYPGVSARLPARDRVAPVPRFLPFAALRYADHEHLATLVAPPYDVLSDADLDHYLALD